MQLIIYNKDTQRLLDPILCDRIKSEDGIILVYKNRDPLPIRMYSCKSYEINEVKE